MIVSSYLLSIEYVNVKFERSYRKVSEYDQEISHKKTADQPASSQSLGFIWSLRPGLRNIMKGYNEARLFSTYFSMN